MPYFLFSVKNFLYLSDSLGQYSKTVSCTLFCDEHPRFVLLFNPGASEI